MRAYIICGGCGHGYNPQKESHSCSMNRSKSNAQLSEAERPILWIHPKTGEVRYPGRNDGVMPKYYSEQGYEKKEFTSYQEHQNFCDSKYLVNHAVEGIR